MNSGSEATDLAIRIARVVATERRKKDLPALSDSNTAKATAVSLNRDTICLAGAYHGGQTCIDYPNLI